jgi:hypothetical protein
VQVVNARLALCGHFTPQLPVLSGLREPKPYLLSPVEFLPVVWTEIALNVGNAKGSTSVSLWRALYTDREKAEVWTESIL